VTAVVAEGGCGGLPTPTTDTPAKDTAKFSICNVLGTREIELAYREKLRLCGRALAHDGVKTYGLRSEKRRQEDRRSATRPPPLRDLKL
jgi:hypothetical protein